MIHHKDGVDYREHRMVMEKHLGRKLLASEIVHHINENTLDNRIENLEVMGWAEHIRHHKIGKLKPGNTKEVKKCSKCEIIKSRDKFYKNKTAYDGIKSSCASCSQIENKNRKK